MPKATSQTESSLVLIGLGWSSEGSSVSQMPLHRCHAHAAGPFAHAPLERIYGEADMDFHVAILQQRLFSHSIDGPDNIRQAQIHKSWTSGRVAINRSRKDEK